MTNKEAAILILQAFESLSLQYTSSTRIKEAFAMAVGKLMNGEEGEEDNEDYCDKR